MVRFFSNMLFIIIIFLLLTAMPLSTDILTINIFQPVAEIPKTEEPIHLSYTLFGQFDSIDYTPEYISFSIKSDSSVNLDPPLNSIEIDIYDGEQLLSSTSLDKLSPSYKPLEDGSFEITAQISSILDAFKPSLYRMEIRGAEGSNVYEKISLLLSNEAYDKKLLKANSENTRGMFGITLYYPTEAYELLIPISRHIKWPDNRARAILRELDNGPATNLGLISGDNIWPYSHNLTISSGVASVHLRKSEYQGFEANFDKAVAAITGSLISLETITEATFYLDNSNSTPFGGVDLKQRFTHRSENLAYLSYTNNSEYMLMLPVPFESLGIEKEASVEEKCLAVWASLSSPRTSEIYPESTKFIYPTIPMDIKPQTIAFNDGKLTIDVSETFQNAYAGSQQYIDRMLLSIGKSYYSIADIKEVYITINGEAPQSFYGHDLTIPLKNPIYLNLEP